MLAGKLICLVLKAGALLCCGALISVGIAWWISEASKEERQTTLKGDGWTTVRLIEVPRWTFATQSRFGVLRAVAQCIVTPERAEARDAPAGTFPRWCSIHHLEAVDPLSVLDANEGFRVAIVYEDWAFGWPFAALSFRYKLASRRWPDDSSLCWGDVHLPIRPNWTGVTGNTFVYAGAIWIGMAGLSSALRRLRVRAGRCAMCAHLTAGSDRCPECGYAFRPIRSDRLIRALERSLGKTPARR